jgi:hypothetical protein
MIIDEPRLQRVLDEALRSVTVSGACAVALEGSIAEGFGNEASDVDFVVIDEGEARPRMPTLLFIDGLRVEVRIRTAREMRRQAEELLSTARRGRRHLAALDEEALDRCQRFSRAVPLRRAEVVEDIRRSLPAEALAEIVATWFAEAARVSIRNAVVLHALGQDEQAVSWGRSAVTQAAKSWLARRGETYLAKKWLSQQILRSAADDPRSRRIRALEASQGSATEAGGYLEDVRCLLAELGIREDEGRAHAVTLVRRARVTTWPIGSRVHVVRDRTDLFALDDRAALVWRSLAFHVPLPRLLAAMPVAREIAGRAIAEFHRLGLIDIRWKDGTLLRARGTSSLAPATARPILGMGGATFPEPGSGPIALAPVPASRFAAAGMQLSFVNMIIENAREDARGALQARQWPVFERSARRLLRHACMATLSAHAIDPLPPVEEVHACLDLAPGLSATLKAEVLRLDASLGVTNEIDAVRTLHTLDGIVLAIRDLTGTSLFPSCFISADEWQRTLDIGYDWVRLGAYLDADFPVDQVRDVLSTGGQQPHVRADHGLSREIA